MNSATLDDKGVVIPCPNCGQKNRTPFEKLNEQGQCGRCKGELPAPSTPIEVDTEAHFVSMLRLSALPVVVDYWAPWCGPCRQFSPELAKVAAANAGRWLFVKVNTEALPRLGQRQNIQSIPTVVIFYKGNEAARTSGAHPAASVEKFLQQTWKTHIVRDSSPP